MMMAPIAPWRAASSIFIGPAPVVGERLAVEKFGVVGGRLAGEQHHHFAAHVDALVVVPLVFRRDDAMAHEHGVGIEFDVGLLLEGDADEIVQPAEGKM